MQESGTVPTGRLPSFMRFKRICFLPVCPWDSLARAPLKWYPFYSPLVIEKEKRNFQGREVIFKQIIVYHESKERWVMPSIEENILRFETLLGSVKRDGIDRLIGYIRKNTDLYKAPASSRYHLACEGGLLQHSLNVYDCLLSKRESPVWKEVLKDLPDESLILIALLHDLCKTNFYVEGTRNQKTYDPEKVAAAEKWQRKHDAQGDFIWETVKSYQVEDQLPLGHGEKSVMLVQCYIRLKMPEVMGIRWHMGFSEEKASYSSLGSAMTKYPVVLAVHEADLEATYILEADS